MIVDTDVAPAETKKPASFIASLKPGVSAMRALSSSSQVLKRAGHLQRDDGLVNRRQTDGVMAAPVSDRS